MKESTIEILKKAGWYPNRKIDVIELIELYEKKGFEIFPKAKAFLEEYGMLNVYLPTIRPGVSDEYVEKHKLHKFDLYNTNMIRYLNGGLSRETISEYEEDYVEEKLVVVASLAKHEYLMISESGKLFTEYGFWGNNAEEFWDRILNYEFSIQWIHWDGFI